LSWKLFKIPDLIHHIFSHAAFLSRSDSTIDIILNPYAGAFRRPDLLLNLQRHFEEFLRVLPNQSYFPEKVFLRQTSSPNDEYQIVKEIIRSHDSEKHRLVVIAGGDGTANKVLSAFLLETPKAREGLLFFRLPLGTGNDFADAPDLSTVFKILMGRAEPLYPPYLEYKANGQPHGFGFNIGSIGLDAWVVKTNEKLRKILPGNFYKIAADIAGLFYEANAKPGALKAEYFFQGKKVGESDGRFLLTAFAPDGYRTYGGGIKVLPDEENLCRVSPVSLMTFFTLKSNFYKGLHPREIFTTMIKFDRVVFYAEKRLVAQHDGEIFWLEPEMCPYEVRVLPGDLGFLRYSSSK